MINLTIGLGEACGSSLFLSCSYQAQKLTIWMTFQFVWQAQVFLIPFKRAAAREHAVNCVTVMISSKIPSARRCMSNSLETGLIPLVYPTCETRSGQPTADFGTVQPDFRQLFPGYR